MSAEGLERKPLGGQWGLNPGQGDMMEGDGPLASTKWVLTYHCVQKGTSIYQKKIHTEKVYPCMACACGRACLGAILRASMLAQTLCIAAGFVGPPP